MIQAPTILKSLKQVARVSVVAAFTASTLALIGATGEGRTAGHKSNNKRTSSVQLASLGTIAKAEIHQAPAAAWGELLVDDSALPAAKATPAVVSVPTTRTIRMEVTAYCPCVKCCGPKAQGITASGKLISHNGGKFVAADTSVLPFGTKLIIPGYADNQAVEVADRGGAIKGNKLDLFFPTHEAALAWGHQMVEVTVIQ
jgi:3D (Asp-Asp-Asp) domain-containing protein